MMNKDKPVSQENIRDEKGRFKKGFSGNPKGCPPGVLNLTTKLRIAMEKLIAGDKTVADAFIDKLILLAVKKGDMNAVKEIMNRMDGKVPDKVEHVLTPGWEAVYEEETPKEKKKNK